MSVAEKTISNFSALKMIAVFVVGCLLGIHFYIKHLYQARISAMENLLEEFAEN